MHIEPGSVYSGSSDTEFLKELVSFACGSNPRAIKRLFNIISLKNKIYTIDCIQNSIPKSKNYQRTLTLIVLELFQII